MKLDEYQRKAFLTARIDWQDARKCHIPVLGVVGELGSLASELKKQLRDGQSYNHVHRNLIEEFGDLLWYISAIASRYQLSLEGLVAETHSSAPSRGNLAHVYGMVSAIAALVASTAESGKDVAPGTRRRIAKALGPALHAVLFAIRREGLNLTSVLSKSLQKVTGVFGSEEIRPARCFDTNFPVYERLPRSIAVQFLERARGAGRVEVVLRVNGMNMGDRLTDNARKDDGYRFHDAFHLAYAAVLGWSPVVRSMLRCKRKSDPGVDEVQDGARAAIVEEAIAQTVFDYARSHSMLNRLDRIDNGILKLIQRMVHGLEVRKCALHEWQRAIFVGFEAFRALKRNRGGSLILDAETRTLSYRDADDGANNG